MKEYLKGTRLANKIRMLRSMQKEHSLLVVEGTTDKRFYGKFVDHTACRIEVALSKENVIDSMMELNRTETPGVLGVVDADYMHLDGTTLEVSGVYVTDTHDIETLILRSSALEDVLAEYADMDRYQNFIDRTGLDIRDILLRNGYRVGALRWLALRSAIYLRFDNLDLSSCMSGDTYLINPDLLIQNVIRNSNPDKLRGMENLEVRLESIEQGQYDPWQMSRGHDLVALLLILLKLAIGTKLVNQMNEGQLEGSLRLAFDEVHFQETRLYQSIQAWEQEHAPYQVLRPGDDRELSNSSFLGVV